MLLAGKAEYENRTKEHVMIEGINVDKLDHLPSPRLLNTHLTAAMLPRQVTEKRVKVIHVYRNVKDVLVSLYFHMKQLGPYLLREPTLEAVEEMFLSEQCTRSWSLRPFVHSHRLVGLVVKASASRAEDPGFESRLRRDFSRVESYQ